jgi:dihydrofolate synthase / folylpolyglutamate synthase
LFIYSLLTMTYQETLDYMYALLPMYQRIGAAAYKANLDNTIALCNYLGNPETKFKSIHIAGTNGKGSSSHITAAILQTAGHKTGLYTSPHLKSFRERIKINGEEIAQDFIVDFITKHKEFIENLQPSFFELTVGMAFLYFANQNIDVAVIEVGLGGRLDSTNVILPDACLITNISYDHQNLLGDTLPKIAAEKAGIIKPKTPVTISQTQFDVAQVFVEKADQCNAPIVFADKNYWLDFKTQSTTFDIYKNDDLFLSDVICELKGDYQPKNIRGVLQLIDSIPQYNITKEHILQGLAEVCTITGFKGRWQMLNQEPLIICDIGHNEDGIRQVVKQINRQSYKTLHFVFGVVNDKSIDKMLVQLPKNAIYYFCKPNIPRGLDSEELQKQAQNYGLNGNCYDSVADAFETAKIHATFDDMIFIGGSTFIVAEI